MAEKESKIVTHLKKNVDQGVMSKVIAHAIVQANQKWDLPTVARELDTMKPKDFKEQWIGWITQGHIDTMKEAAKIALTDTRFGKK